MSINHQHKNAMRDIFMKWLPVLITVVVIFVVPPAAFAVIAAYFTAPILTAVRQVIKLPLTLATLFVMTSLFFIAGAFMLIGLHGIIEIIPAVERQLAPYTQNTDSIGKTLAFLEGKITQYGHALLDYAVTMLQTIFQHLMSLFIFLVAYFFALRESGKDQFWFLIYFPANIRKSAKRMLVEAGKLIGTFVYVEARLVFLTFIILTVGFSLLRFDSPIGTAFLISLVDSLPFLGIGLFLIPMAAFFFHTGDLFITVSLVLLYLFALTTRQFAESYLWASTFQLKPVHAFFVTACAVYLFGVAGILLTPFLLFAALKIKRHPLFT